MATPRRHSENNQPLCLTISKYCLLINLSIRENRVGCLGVWFFVLASFFLRGILHSAHTYYVPFILLNHTLTLSCIMKFSYSMLL